MLKQGMETQPKTRFKDRRVRVFEGGFVQQHTIYVTQANGFVGQMDVCFVGYVRDGMISRAYEYFDTGQIEKFIGPRGGLMTLPAEGLVERVAALAPMIAERSFEAEAQRRPLDEVIDALKATGVFRSFVPKRYGGYEIDMQTFVDIGIARRPRRPVDGVDHHLLHGAQLAAQHVPGGAAGRDLQRPALRAGPRQREPHRPRRAAA